MKIYSIYNTPSQIAAIDVLPDTALLRNNESFYLPDFSKNICATFGFAFQISKLGKEIAPQFANRYITSMSIAVWFRALDLEQSCLEQNASPIIARGFDKSFAVSPIILPMGDVLDKEIIGCFGRKDFAFRLSNEYMQETYQHFSKATRFITCKIGDLFFVSASELSEPIEIGQQYMFDLQGNRIFSCEIK